MGHRELVGPTEIPVLFIQSNAHAQDGATVSGEHAEDFAEAAIFETIAQVYVPGDTLLWLAPDSMGLANLAYLRTTLPELPMVVGPDPGLALHIAAGKLLPGPVFWAVWTNDGFADWATRYGGDGNSGENQDTNTFPSNDWPAQAHAHAVYSVYAAACAGMHDGDVHTSDASGTWRIRLLPVAGPPTAASAMLGSAMLGSVID